jgi:hypothetical protein
MAIVPGGFAWVCTRAASAQRATACARPPATYEVPTGGLAGGQAGADRSTYDTCLVPPIQASAHSGAGLCSPLHFLRSHR